MQYTTETEIRDYVRWRQVDSEPVITLLLVAMLTGIYSTHQQSVQHVFLGIGPARWHEQHGGQSSAERKHSLVPTRCQSDGSFARQGTVSAQKNELLFSRFKINYNDLDPMFRKGSLLLFRVSAFDEVSLVFSN